MYSCIQFSTHTYIEAFNYYLVAHAVIKFYSRRIYAARFFKLEGMVSLPDLALVWNNTMPSKLRTLQIVYLRLW